MRFFLILLLPQFIWAQIWVHHKAYMPDQSQANSKNSLAQKQLKEILNYKNAKKELKQRLMHAQEVYYNSQRKDLVIQAFKTVVNLSYQAPWNINQRKAIHYAYGKIAQFSSKTRSYWLEKAIFFAPDLTLDPNVFPPDLQKKYLRLKLKLKPRQITWNFKQDYPQAKYILINGKIYDTQKHSEIAISPNKLRIDILSSSFMPIKFIGNGVDFLISPQEENYIVTGSCKYPVLNKKLEYKIDLVYFSKNCIATLNSPNRKKTLDLKPKMKLVANSIEVNSQILEPKKERKWSYWMAAAAITFIAISSRKNKGGSKETPPKTIVIED